MVLKFNEDNWPVVYFYLGDEEINEELFENYKVNYLNLLIKCKKEKKKMILISDLNTEKSLPIKYVMKQAMFNRKINKFNELYVSAVCIYCKNKSFKNILKMYFTLTKPASPYKLCTSLEKINKFLDEKINYKFDARIYENFNKSSALGSNNYFNKEDLLKELKIKDYKCDEINDEKIEEINNIINKEEINNL